MAPKPPHEPAPSQPTLKIIHVGLWRMGTMSMSRAYSTLGFRTFHGLDTGILHTPWRDLERAADATWPRLRARGKPPIPPFTRADWDALWACDVATDLASPFVPQLLAAYPDAKVVVCQRPFETWWPSFTHSVVMQVMGEPWATVNHFLGIWLFDLPTIRTAKKLLRGFLGVHTLAEMLDEENGRRRYDAYFEEVRRLVPPEKRLEYRLGDGWEPLCEYLGVEVPDGVPFPRVNQKDSTEGPAAAVRGIDIMIAKMAIKWLLGLVVAWVAWRWVRGQVL